MADQEKQIFIRKLKHKRSGIKIQFNNLKKIVGKLDCESADSEKKLQYRVPKLEECYVNYIDIYTQLIEVASDLESEDVLVGIENDRCEFEDQFFDLKLNFDKYLKQFAEAKNINLEQIDKAEENNLDNISECRGNSEVRDDISGEVKLEPTVKEESKSLFKAIQLPRITLPRFDGKLEKWLRFKDSFKSMIINNPDLTDVERFYYLDGNLDGDAKKTIEVVEFSEKGFQNAWSALNFKYDNKRAIIDKHMHAFFNLKTINKESGVEIRKLLDDSLIHIRALESLGEKITDSVAVHTLKQRLDCETRKSLENENKTDKPLTWAQLVEFLQRRCLVLEAMSNLSYKPTTAIPYNNRKPHSRSFVATMPNRTLYCSLCKKDHLIINCAKFLNMSVQHRYEKTRELGLCLNCLKGKHRVIDCRAPFCNYCHRKHSSLLHMGNSVQTSPTTNEIVTSATKSNQFDHDSSSQSASGSKKLENISESYAALCSQKDSYHKQQVVLSTAVIFIKDANGRYHLCRTLLDSASQSNFATQKLSDKLRLRKEELSHLVLGLNHAKTNIQHKFSSTIKSRISTYNRDLEFLVVPEIGSNMPSNYINITYWNIPHNLELADPSFNIPEEIDLLLGAEVFFRILTNGRFELAKNLPSLQNTLFGWIVSGKVECQNHFVSEDTNFSFCNFNASHNDNSPTNCELDKRLTRFWEFENFENNSSKLSIEEKKCEEIFKNSYTRNKEGRFVVNLPFKENINQLSALGNVALKRFSYLESKLNENRELKAQYLKFLREYEELGHMSLSMNQSISEEEYYLPHHAVLKPDSSTTKLRVVFDASARTHNGLSLNDVLMTGPVVQSELFDIILRFRKYVYVYTTDIQQMYRQINIIDEHTQYQKILWRENKNEPIKIFKLNTVTYGTSAAPYLATKVLQQLGIDENKKYPLASKIIQQDFYVDDGLFGSNNLEEAIEMKSQLITMLQGAGMKLRKWTANSEKLLESIPLEDREITCNSINETIKTLGLVWHPILDQFMFHVEPINNDKAVTKRNVLSDISKLFDPLGLISPIIVVAKILMQRIWLSKVSWDDPISENLSNIWLKYRSQLSSINKFKLDRCLIPKETKIIEMHGFADASEQAYGACVYFRCTDEIGNVVVNLICSKSRIAPVKIVSVPRLELNAALLLSKLVARVLKAMELSIERIILWSDSTIALSWIRLPPYKLKTYVAHRVSEIQGLTESMNWRHIDGKVNPADHVSRGKMPNEFAEIKNWWNGPDFLHEHESKWPSKFKEISQIDLPEIKKDSDHTFVSTKHQEFIDIERYSSLKKLIHVVAYCLRFINNAQPKKNIKVIGQLSTKELSSAMKALIRTVQSSQFSDEIKLLANKIELPKNNKLSSLSPFVDGEGLLRVGGRIKYSSLDVDQKHPYLLDKNHMTTLIIEQEHQRNLHSGVQATLSFVRQRYWPINAKNLVKAVLHKCINCFKLRPKTLEQVMGNLPSSRIEGSYPFSVTGVDFCGPFEVKYKHHRKGPFHKIYLCLFVCFASKAVHIEVIEDATSDAFIAGLKRFIGRRGRCSTIWSDNGTNFVGANNKLKHLESLFKLEHKEKITHFMNEEGIEWKFIPPRSPHFGGLWEAGIKSLKTHLKKVVGNSILTLEQMYTLSAEIEGILNSRPLTPLSSDPKDDQPLTPAHFLVGRPINRISEPNIEHLPTNRISHWQIITKMTQHFWKRFSKEYIHTLQERKKWVQRKENLKVNDLVIVQEDNIPPNKWLLGRVEAVIVGKDQQIRVASVRTKNGIIKRAITKLARLPISV